MFYGLVRVEGNFARTNNPYESGPYAQEKWVASYDPDDTARPLEEFVAGANEEEAFAELCERYPVPQIDGVALKRVSGHGTIDGGTKSPFTVSRLPKVCDQCLTLTQLQAAEAYLAGEPEQTISLWNANTDAVALTRSAKGFYESNLIIDYHRCLRYNPARAKARRTRKVNRQQWHEQKRLEAEKQTRRRQRAQLLLEDLGKATESVFTSSPLRHRVLWLGPGGWHDIVETLRTALFAWCHLGRAEQPRRRLVNVCKRVLAAVQDPGHPLQDALKDGKANKSKLEATLTATIAQLRRRSRKEQSCPKKKS